MILRCVSSACLRGCLLELTCFQFGLLNSHFWFSTSIPFPDFQHQFPFLVFQILQYQFCLLFNPNIFFNFDFEFAFAYLTFTRALTLHHRIAALPLSTI
jgi:hypothetical protein